MRLLICASVWLSVWISASTSSHAQFRADSVYSAKAKYDFLKEFYDRGNTFYLLNLDSTRIAEVESFDSGFFRLYKVSESIPVQSPILLGLQEKGTYSGTGALIGLGCDLLVMLAEVISRTTNPDPEGFSPLLDGLVQFIIYGPMLVGTGALIGLAFSNNTFYPIGLLQ